ncbi:hypothetical protein RJT34_11653 [Clitoria ternatea]|uniref:Uncharacterized protein n=1 Tax=Clitoria ternatea TaxID=43366 RepID=A0AAN9JMX6_CLITE
MLGCKQGLHCCQVSHKGFHHQPHFQPKLISFSNFSLFLTHSIHRCIHLLLIIHYKSSHPQITPHPQPHFLCSLS